MTPTPPAVTYNEIVGTAGNDVTNGTSGADHLQGLAGNDTLNGLAGDDWLEGGANNDKLYGGDGNDILSGGAGSNVLNGGAGADIYVVTAEAGSDVVQGFVVGEDHIDVAASGAYTSLVQNGSDTLITFASGRTMLLKAVSAATVTSDSFVTTPAPPPTPPPSPPVYNEIVGTAGNDVTNGTSGADHVQGLAGNDTLNGLAGNDWLEGGANNDKLYGGDGDDILSGGAGSNVLNGGAGADIYVVTAEAGSDVVQGFVVGEDHIDVAASGAYTSLVQSGSDTLITFASGRTMLLKAVSAATVTSDSFVGMTGGASSTPMPEKQSSIEAGPDRPEQDILQPVVPGAQAGSEGFTFGQIGSSLISFSVETQSGWLL